MLAFVGLLFLAALGYFGYAVVNSYRAQARVADTFLPVEATVVSSDVRSSSSGSRNAPRVYAVQIEYRYTVDGQVYRSHRYAYTSQGFQDYDEAKNVVDRHPAGAGFTAYYDPASPADAVIDRTPPRRPPAVMVLPFVLLGLAGLVMLVYGLRGSPAS